MNPSSSRFSPVCARVLASALLLIVTACADINHTKIVEGEAPVVFGPAVRNNVTPLEPAYACYAEKLRQSGIKLSVGVGDIRDYTGKASDLEGTVVTQGGPLMLYSALGKLGDPIELHERFDTRIAELELAYLDRRQLGDGTDYEMNGQLVPWKPYFGGTIQESSYFIVGGITEVNYNIQSGGLQGSGDLIGPRARTFTMGVAVDLRMVNTSSLTVVATSSLSKQVIGYEVGFELFSFFGTTLVDINAGLKNQEPIQLAVRTVLELALLDLLGKTTRVFYQDCVSDYFDNPSQISTNKSETPPEEPASQAAAPALDMIIDRTAALPEEPAVEVAAMELDASAGKTEALIQEPASDAAAPDLDGPVEASPGTAQSPELIIISSQGVTTSAPLAADSPTIWSKPQVAELPATPEAEIAASEELDTMELPPAPASARAVALPPAVPDSTTTRVVPETSQDRMEESGQGTVAPAVEGVALAKASVVPDTEQGLIAVTAADIPDTEGSVTGDSIIWLGSAPNEAEAQALASDLKARFPDLLAVAAPSVQQVNIGNEQVWRVIVSHFERRAAAEAFCNALKARDQALFCKPTSAS